jgi:hypothetical protein
MKNLLLFGLLLSLSACSPPTPYTVEHEEPKVDPTQTAVTAYLKKTLDNYEIIRWCPPETWTSHDSLLRIVAPIKHGGVLSAADWKYVRDVEASRAFNDTTPIGTWLTCTYRTQTAQGSSLLDSTQFVVYNTGKVQALDSLPTATAKSK